MLTRGAAEPAALLLSGGQDEGEDDGEDEGVGEVEGVASLHVLNCSISRSMSCVPATECGAGSQG